jgi:thiamine pyrophosphate-dependent acetolactate synthase large subunit-like protein
MTEMTGGEVLVRSLVAHGVQLVFGIPGTHNLEIYRHLAAAGIRHVTPRHEQGAGYAADGYARTTGRPAVALTTTGPAVLNIAAAVGQAYSDSVPMLVVAPGPPRRHPQRGTGMLHEMRDQRGAMAAITSFSRRVSTHAELTETVAEAFAAMGSRRPRPAYLEVPLDLLAEAAEVSIVDPLPVARWMPDPELVKAAASQLARAERPGLLLGGGVRAAAAPARALAEALGAPVLTTTNGKGVLPEDHPLAVGAALHLPAASAAVAEFDVLLAVGTELASSDWWDGPPVPRHLIRVDLDPDQVLVNARPDLAITADADATLQAIAAVLPSMPPRDAELAGTQRQRLRAEAREQGARWLSTMDAIAAALKRDAVVCADNAMACYYGALGNLPVRVPGGFCFPTGFGTLGYAVPAALGAALGGRGRQVLALVGDGGLMFSAPELAVVAAERIALPVVVFVNGGYGEIRAQMNQAGIAPIAVDLPAPDLVGLARALGGHGVLIRDGAQLTEELHIAFRRPTATLLVVDEGRPA